MHYDERFPAAVQLPGGHGVLNVYDDGVDFSVMAVAEGRKAGTGTGATTDDVGSFASQLAEHLAE